MGDSEGTKGHGGDKGTPRGYCFLKGCPLPASPGTQPPEPRSHGLGDTGVP